MWLVLNVGPIIRPWTNIHHNQRKPLWRIKRRTEDIQLAAEGSFFTTKHNLNYSTVILRKLMWAGSIWHWNMQPFSGSPTLRLGIVELPQDGSNWTYSLNKTTERHSCCSISIHNLSNLQRLVTSPHVVPLSFTPPPPPPPFAPPLLHQQQWSAGW